MQPVLSLAQHYELTPEQGLRKLAGFFYRLGADAVLDMTVADDFALIEAAKEFIERYKASKEGTKNQLPMLSSSCPGKTRCFIRLDEKTPRIYYSFLKSAMYNRLGVLR